MSETGFYQIEAQSYGILGTASHDFWVLRNSDGAIVQELQKHGGQAGQAHINLA